ncbi:MAG: radical SAM protein [Peptococcaceae bacterium]|nr:B12-binding domain-containing radical SAM protein [Peptococcaceae bacterium]MDH7524218.1 radical SAM protein [Peptococcaceae bacterium]
MKENVLLVYAPMDDYYYTEGVNDSPPLGLVALQNYVLRNEGLRVKVDIIDGEYHDLQEICEMIDQGDYDLVGIQPMMASYSNTLGILQKAKEKGITTVMGGHHATHLADRIIKNRSGLVDFIIVGDGEEAFASLVKEEPPERIPNLVYLHPETREVVCNETRNVPIDDGKIDYIDEKVLQQYRNGNHKTLERGEALASFRAYSHKGCSNRLNSQYCFFCGRADRGVRFKKPEVYLEELKYLAGMPSVRYVFEIGDDFLQSGEWLARLCELKEKHMPGNGMHLKIFARANRITPEIIDYLKRLDIDEVAIGFESGSEKILRNINKHASPADNLRAAELLYSHGIDTIASFVLGLPGEDKESLAKTYEQAQRVAELSYKYLHKAPQEVIANLIEINPGSPAYRKVERHLPQKYSQADSLDVREVQDDYFRVEFGLKSPGEIEAFRRELAAWGQAINRLGQYTYPAGWRRGDLA